MIIVFEGIDGSGKSTLVDLVHKAIPEYTTVVRELYDTQLGQLVWNYIRLNPVASPVVEMLLANAVRLETLEKYKPEEHPLIAYLYDRYYYSTAVYQQEAQHSDPFLYYALMQQKRIPRPDLTFYIRITPEVSLQRGYHKESDLFELRDRVALYEKYEEIFRNEDNVFTVDGTAPIAKNVEFIVKTIMTLRTKRLE